MRKLALFLPIVLILAACASLGVPTPKTLNERIAAGYVSVTGARNMTLTLLNGGVIGSEDAERVQAQLDNAKEGLDIARTLPAAEAETRVQTALTILQAARSYLCGKSPTDPNCQRATP